MEMPEEMKVEPLVTICIFAYNHEKYIEEAVLSVLFQRTTFPIEILIGEDGSSDATRDILEKIEKQHPNSFTTIYQDQSKKIYINGNPTGRYNFLNLLERARGKYIALLDGDDYWTDPYKLQKQVDFLKANPVYSICFHPVQVLKDKVFEKDDLRKIGETTSINDLAEGNYIHTPSVVFRNGLFDHNAPIFKKIPAGDYLVHMLNAKKGLIKKLDEPMAVYRKHDKGIWSPAKDKLRHERWVKMMELMIDFFKDDQVLVDSFKVQRDHSMTKINDAKLLNKLKHFLKTQLGLIK